MTTPWWQTAVIYQVYPRSFRDSDGNGVGDLRGIVSRLDHIADLGGDAVWVSPIYASPMADFGYDVSDYCAIDPLFGTMDDFTELVQRAHARSLKVILDFVPNHSSNQHPWFLESRSRRDSSKRDWYIWRDAAPDGGAPNNWLSHFGGSSWEWDEATGQYYLHSFLKEQPDLNWRHPAVQAAMYDVLRFWLELGVDGFRVDVLWLLIKDDLFRDNPPNPAYKPGQTERDRLLSVYDADRPETLAIVEVMRAILDSYGERLLIGEIYLPIERLVAYYGNRLQGAQLPFNFQLITAAWTAEAIAGIVRDYEAALPPDAWPNYVLGNHDQARLASRIGASQARVAATLLLTLRGTPTIYYGEEIGMTDVAIAPGEVQDPAEKNQPGLGLGRDPERTPMPWTNGVGAGFTSGKPWLPIGADNAGRNVETQAAEERSVLSLYRTLIALRRRRPALLKGTIEAVEARGSVLAFERRDDAERIGIFLNMGDEPAVLGMVPGTIILSTNLERTGETVGTTLTLRPDEGVLIDLL